MLWGLDDLFSYFLFDQIQYRSFFFYGDSSFIRSVSTVSSISSSITTMRHSADKHMKCLELEGDARGFCRSDRACSVYMSVWRCHDRSKMVFGVATGGSTSKILKTRLAEKWKLQAIKMNGRGLFGSIWKVWSLTNSRLLSCNIWTRAHHVSFQIFFVSVEIFVQMKIAGLYILLNVSAHCARLKNVNGIWYFQRFFV